MTTVKILSGAYGFKAQNGFVRPVPFGKCCEVSDEEAARLVSIGAAEIVGKDVVAGDGYIYIRGGSARPCDISSEETSVITAENKNGAEATQEAPEYSMQNTLKELTAICEANDIDIPAKATKRVLIELLDNAFDGSSPDLTAEMPV